MSQRLEGRCTVPGLRVIFRVKHGGRKRPGKEMELLLAGSVIFREKGRRRRACRKMRFEITHARDFERQ
jgi:hypothetical protein